MPASGGSRRSILSAVMGMGLIVLIAALVLGLLIASAKSAHDTQNTQIKQMTANFILLDLLLAAMDRVGAERRERYREVLGTLKWGIMCIAQAFTHLSGTVRSVELAAIGRRVCENEWDLLNMLGGSGVASS